MTRASASDLLRRRLRAQSLSAGAPDVVAAAARLLAVQAQDLPAARWALGVRSPGAVDRDVTDALDTGILTRHWPLRGTLQLVARDDLRWLLALTGERQWSATARIRSQWGVTDALLDTARTAAVDLLEGGRAASRAELAAGLTAAGVDMTGGRGYQVIYALAITGTLVWGRADGASQRLALLDERVPPAPSLDRDEALARLAARYLAGHGAATAADLAWWAGIPLSWARRGVQAAGARGVEHAGMTYFIDEQDALPPAPGVILLPGFDEYLLGYRHRDLALAPEHAARVAPTANGRFLPVVVTAGRTVGTWRATDSGVDVEPFAAASAPDPGEVAAAAARHAAFVRGSLA
ncbi:MAG: winged helix DNA-binding domain-containing protein [Microbacteriaceae bacterium]|nr:winged helix DNA-binding domain-containing protein [Microbacteriaceae bacterium]MCL2795956.1 winged helix DNA-binding domain-containing protein [Microbacteriaceae bacterium]